MRSPVPFHVIINPRLTVVGGETADFFEGCLSCGQYMGAVERALRVRVECLNEKAEPVVIEAEGWYARILQHEIDHLNGKLFLDKVDTRTLMTVENYSKYWAGETTDGIKEKLSLAN
jgi:peptide deformylase